MQNKVDISETFPNHQFKINGYKMYHRDRKKNGGGVICYIHENIPVKW